MCTVDKMLIKGIRSFSPENTSVITFFKPLTLIVGPNGAGKTTIIECLKCATTGELPPNARSGHSFIHDPKVAHMTETKGQIKLRFRTAAGKDVVSTRNFTLTQKASKMEFKAIESVLQTINSITGERVSLSYRCADMDREIPLLMGVPKAVLENVIFVHQDDANWPLAEGAVLKKKFDDIFSATKYTKALEALKKVHKEQAQLIKEMKLKAENLKNIRDTALRLEESIKADSGQSERLAAQIERLEGQIAERRERQGEVETALARLRQMMADVQTQEGRLELLSRQKVQQRANIVSDNQDSDEQLQAWHKEFEGVVAKVDASLAQTTRALSELRIQNEAERDRSERDKQLISRLQVEKEVYERDCGERDKCLQELFIKYELGEVGPLPLASDEAVEAGMRAGARLSELQGRWEDIKRAQQGEERRRGAEIEAAGGEIVKAEGQLHIAQERKRSSEARRQQLKGAMDSSAVDEDGMARLEREEKKAKAEADRLAAKLRDPNLLSKLEDAKTDLSRQEQRQRGLQREKDSLAAESSERVTLRLKQEALREKEAQLKKLLAESKGRVEGVVGCEMPSDARKLLQEVEKAARSQRAEYEEADREAKEAGNEAAVQQQRLDHARKELAQRSNEMDAKRVTIQARLSSAVDPSLAVDELDRVRGEKRAALEDAIGKYESFLMLEQFWGRFIQEAQSKHRCHTCERKFSKAEEAAFIQKTRAKKADSVGMEARVRGDKERLVQQLGILDDLHPVYNEYRKLVDEVVPNARTALGHVEEAQIKAQERYESLLCLLAERKARLDALPRVEAVAKEAERLKKEADALSEEVASLEYRLDMLSQGMRSLADVNADLAAAEEKRDAAARDVERLREEHGALKDEAAAASNRWRGAREERAQMALKVARRREMEEEVGQLDVAVEESKLEMQALERSIGPLRKKHGEAVEGRKVWRERASAEEAEMQGRVRGMQRDLDGMRGTFSKVNQYLDSNKDEQLVEATERLQQSQARQSSNEQQIQQLGAKEAEEREMLRNQSAVKRNVEAILVFRATEREEAGVRGEVERLRGEMGRVGRVGELEEEVRGVREEIDGLAAEQNHSRGKVAAHEASIRRSQAELKAPQFRDIENRHRKQLIQLKTSELANRDIDKYYNALDKALMRFHAMKMEEINKIIKELWQQTYRGQDIDYIEIRSDAEGAGTRSYCYRDIDYIEIRSDAEGAGTRSYCYRDIDYIEIRSDAEGAGTRSYCYRVVMRSGDAELDMRGRCSAGQKVLASLIIRLALAETFCLNCGILALDEPTTNLDAPNAESLARALNRLMEERRSQENFQLIVITHDEIFAEMIGRKEHADHYYRISKDERQRSTIAVQDIYD
ncbi:hypothetical protein CLOP_g6708 [Closterium sp. NIES-67]|nr:hypothetical protein CLOP_g6708 [Closterium sp. NIES-67]